MQLPWKNLKILDIGFKPVIGQEKPSWSTASDEDGS